jgi:hypothetical protein
MLATIYITDCQGKLKRIEHSPYKTAAVTWLLLNRFEQDGDQWINPFTRDVAKIYSNTYSEGENDD